MIEHWERPPFEVRLRLKFVAALHWIANALWTITGKPFERLAIAVAPDPRAMHCPACWCYQQFDKSGAVKVKHKKSCEYVRLIRSERAWTRADGTPDTP